MTLSRSLFWSLEQFGMMTLQLVNMAVITRLLTPEEIGVFFLYPPRIEPNNYIRPEIREKELPDYER